MGRMHRVTACALALGLLASGCYGPFNLTRRLYKWNGQVGTKWENEFVFIILAWVPVYSIAVLGDGIVFNSMEFWTGKNPVDAPGRSELPQTKHIARGHNAAVLTYQPIAQGATLTVQQFADGRPAGSLRIEPRDGMTVGTDAEGKTVLTAQALSDGSVVVNNAQGKQVAAYSADQVARLRSSARQ